MKQKGFSLVEMMVATVIGMFVIAAALNLYSSTFGANADQMRYSVLNNDLRTVLTKITRDMRRVGHCNYLSTPAATGTPYPVAQQTLPAAGATASEITLRYDLDGAGCTAMSATAVFSYRLHNLAIETRTGTGGWSPLTDPGVIQITAFTVTNHSPPTIDPPNSASSVTIPVYTIEITGRLTRDTAVQRTVREAVRLRNVFTG